MADDIQRVIERALTKLRSEKSRIDRQISALETALAAVRNTASHNGAAPKSRRKMSAESRRAVAKRMKVYWAKRRAAAKAQSKKASKG
jgi:hypothetical protein